MRGIFGLSHKYTIIKVFTACFQLKFMVVIFLHEEEEYVSAAPKKWLCENETIMMWPRNKSIERKAMKLNMNPEEDWM